MTYYEQGFADVIQKTAAWRMPNFRRFLSIFRRERKVPEIAPEIAPETWGDSGLFDSKLPRKLPWDPTLPANLKPTAEMLERIKIKPRPRNSYYGFKGEELPSPSLPAAEAPHKNRWTNFNANHPYAVPIGLTTLGLYLGTQIGGCDRDNREALDPSKRGPKVIDYKGLADAEDAAKEEETRTRMTDNWRDWVPHK